LTYIDEHDRHTQMNMIDIHRKRSRDVLNPKNLLAEMYAWIPLRTRVCLSFFIIIDMYFTADLSLLHDLAPVLNYFNL
jgi:hypothetical protein